MRAVGDARRDEARAGAARERRGRARRQRLAAADRLLGRPRDRRLGGRARRAAAALLLDGCRPGPLVACGRSWMPDPDPPRSKKLSPASQAGRPDEHFPAHPRRPRLGRPQRVLRRRRVRARPRGSDRLDALAEEGAKGAKLARRIVDEIDEYLSACQLGITLASIGIGFLGEVALASQLEPLSATSSVTPWRWRSRWRSPTCSSRALHITVGEQVPKIYAISHPEGVARRTARPLALFARSSSRSSPCSTRPRTRSCAIARRQPRGGLRGGDHVRGPQDADRARRARRHARPRRGGDALGRLPPARAAGAQRDDADPRGGDRRHLGERADRPAALHRLRPHAPARDRGRQHRPRARRGAQQLARPPADDARARRLDRARREGRADRSRDAPARRPARRPPARARVDGGRDRRVRPHVGDRRPSRTSSRRWWGRSRTRPTPPPARCGGWRTATCTCAATWRSTTWPTTAWSCRRLGRLQLGRRARVRRARPAAQARRHGARRRLLAARRVRAREPDRGGADPRPLHEKPEPAVDEAESDS